jgi:cytochrome b561
VAAVNTAAGWGWVSRAFHWLTAVLIAGQLGLALYVSRIDDLVQRFEAAQLHKSWGAVIFGVVVLRLLWRLVGGPAPPQPDAVPRWQRRAAGLSHGGLYALMLCVPLAGWVYASASPLQAAMGIENRVFDLFALPDPWPVGSEALAGAAYVAHRGGAIALAGLVVVHAAAALKHHFVDRDAVLERMLRSRRPR